MGNGTRQRDSAKEQFWRQMLRRQRASGLSVREFCLREGLSRSSFQNWRREIARRDGESTGRSGVARKPRRVNDSSARTDDARRPVASGASAAAFVPVVVAGASPSAAVEVVLADGTTVRIPPGCDRPTLRLVLAALAERHTSADGDRPPTDMNAGAPRC